MSEAGSDAPQLSERKSASHLPMPSSRIPVTSLPLPPPLPPTSSSTPPPPAFTSKIPGSMIPSTQFSVSSVAGMGAVTTSASRMKRTSSGASGSSIGVGYSLSHSLSGSMRAPTPPMGSSSSIGPQSSILSPSSNSGILQRLSIPQGSPCRGGIPSPTGMLQSSPNSSRLHPSSPIPGRTHASHLPMARSSMLPSPRTQGGPSAQLECPRQVLHVHEAAHDGDLAEECNPYSHHDGGFHSPFGDEHGGPQGRVSVTESMGGGESKSTSGIMVSVRLRPISDKERSRGDSELWGIDESFNIGFFNGRERKFVPKYRYDTVFGPLSTNLEVFSSIALPLVEPSLAGFNGTIFAYGVTSSGKTHTMMGNVEAAFGQYGYAGPGGTSGREPGITPLIIKELFDQAAAQSQSRTFIVRLSMMEIYNEVLNDLLDPSRANLKVREDSSHGVVVEGLSEEVMVSAEYALSAILTGEANRKVSSTAYNEDSSRSHTICRLVIEGRDEGGGANEGGAYSGKRTLSVLSLIDLAGSESAKVSLSRGQRMEGSFINKSLLTLGTVINKLAQGHATHIPFRDSKLTRLLQNSLSGKGARISLICNITPASAQGDETANTLKFATRAKLVRVSVSRNDVVDDKTLLRRYAVEIRELRCQLSLLQSSMQLSQLDGAATDSDLEGLTSVSEVGGGETLPSTPGSEIEHLRSRLDVERQAHIRCKQEKALLEVRLRGLVRHLLEKRAATAAAAHNVTPAPEASTTLVDGRERMLSIEPVFYSPAPSLHGSGTGEEGDINPSSPRLHSVPESSELQTAPGANTLRVQLSMSGSEAPSALMDAELSNSRKGEYSYDDDDEESGSDSAVEALIAAMREDVMKDNINLSASPDGSQRRSSRHSGQLLPAAPRSGQAIQGGSLSSTVMAAGDDTVNRASSSELSDSDDKDLEIQVLLADREVLQDQIVTVELVNERLVSDIEELQQQGQQYRTEREKTLRILHELENDMLEMRKFKNQNQADLDTLRRENESLRSGMGLPLKASPSSLPKPQQPAGTDTMGGPYTFEDTSKELGLPLASLLQGLGSDGLATALIDLRRAGLEASSPNGTAVRRISSSGGGASAMSPAMLRQRLQNVQEQVGCVVGACVEHNTRLSAELAAMSRRF